MGANWSESRSDFSSLEEEDVSDDEDLVESSDDLMAKGSRLSIESFDSGVSFKSDWSRDGLIDFRGGVSPSTLDLSSFEKKRDVADDGFSESSDDLMAMGSIESFDSGVSLKSDRSKAEPTDFKDRVSPRPDFSSSEEEDVSDDGVFVSPDDLRAVRRTLSEPAKSDFHIALRQQSPLMMAHSSVEAFGSGLTLMNDSFIRPQQRSLPRMVLRSMEAFGSGLSLMKDSFVRTGQRSPPREEMNQELSSEVGWKHV